MVGSQTPYTLMKKSLTDKSQRKKNSEAKNQHFFSFKTNGRKYNFECPIHGIINSGKIESAYFGRVRSIFDQNSYIMTFTYNNIL